MDEEVYDKYYVTTYYHVFNTKNEDQDGKPIYFVSLIKACYGHFIGLF